MCYYQSEAKLAAPAADEEVIGAHLPNNSEESRLCSSSFGHLLNQRYHITAKSLLQTHMYGFKTSAVFHEELKRHCFLILVVSYSPIAYILGSQKLFQARISTGLLYLSAVFLGSPKHPKVGSMHRYVALPTLSLFK